MNTPKVILRNSVRKDGTCPLVLYVLIGGNKVRIPIGVYVNEDEWDADLQSVKKINTRAKEYNILIGNAIGKASAILRDYALLGKEPTAELFKKEYESDYDRRDFIGFLDNEMNADFQKGEFGANSLKIHRLALRRLRGYMLEQHKQTDLLYSQMTAELFTDFDLWHAKIQKKAGNKGTAPRRKVMNVIRKYLTKARNMGVKVPDVLKNVKIRDVAAPPTFLTENEVRKLISYFESEEIKPNHKKALRGFLFQCFTSLRFSDLKALRKRNIEDGHLVFTPVKTKDVKTSQLRVPLSPIAKSLVVPGEIPIPCFADQVTNRYLKQIANACEINKSLTTHVGRHTFGTMAIDRGVRPNILQKIMGHSSINTTMIYVHLTDRMPALDISKAFDDF